MFFPCCFLLPILFPNIFELHPPPKKISLPNQNKSHPQLAGKSGYLRFEAPLQQFTELWNGIANLTACFLWNRNMHQCTCTRWENIGKTWNKWVTLGDYLSQIYSEAYFFYQPAQAVTQLCVGVDPRISTKTLRDDDSLHDCCRELWMTNMLSLISTSDA